MSESPSPSVSLRDCGCVARKAFDTAPDAPTKFAGCGPTLSAKLSGSPPSALLWPAAAVMVPSNTLNSAYCPRWRGLNFARGYRGHHPIPSVCQFPSLGPLCYVAPSPLTLELDDVAWLRIPLLLFASSPVPRETASANNIPLRDNCRDRNVEQYKFH